RYTRLSSIALLLLASLYTLEKALWHQKEGSGEAKERTRIDSQEGSKEPIFTRNKSTSLI
ncbi:MAG: hypothetical protein JXN62_07710, partial [Bacteroidales bacterium]|nr:hypothetical protein [Bacteroidales bacterium]